MFYILYVRTVNIILYEYIFAAPMITSKTQCFNFVNLKYVYDNINPEHRADYFSELLRKIATTEEIKDGLKVSLMM